MHNTLVWLCLSLAVPMWGCSTTAAGGELVKSSQPRNRSPNVASADTNALVAGNAGFALDLYQQLRTKESNLCFSPYSISVALAMTYAGARGETERQMAETLHFALPQDTLHPALNALDLELAGRGKGAKGRYGEPFRLHIANALWGQSGYSFIPEFLDLLAQNYDAGMRVLDFAASPEPSRGEINQWVAQQTDDKIKELVHRGVISEVTRLVLTNAIYFDAAWESKFEKEATHPAKFTLVDGTEVTVDMMHQSYRFAYAAGDGCQSVEIPYDGRELSMIIMLPAEGRFAGFEKSLDAERMTLIIEELEPTQVRLSMPRFKYESTFQLNESLSAMGMPDAFTPRVANLSGVDGTRNLFVQAVIHKALVRVDEEGTEAAAATAVAVGLLAVPPRDLVELTIDRPFIFLIRDFKTGTILFLGRVLNPTT